MPPVGRLWPSDYDDNYDICAPCDVTAHAAAVRGVAHDLRLAVHWPVHLPIGDGGLEDDVDDLTNLYMFHSPLAIINSDKGGPLGIVDIVLVLRVELILGRGHLVPLGPLQPHASPPPHISFSSYVFVSLHLTFTWSHFFADCLFPDPKGEFPLKGVHCPTITE